MVKFTEEDFHELSDMLDFSYTNIARVANNKLKEWNATIESNNNAFPIKEDVLKPSSDSSEDEETPQE